MAKAAVLFGLSWLASYVSAKDVHLSWNITWVSAAPNGHQRPVIGINDQWPCPQVDVDLGDRLIVDVYNGLGNQTTGIHWHGFHQYMTGTMDGASDATQCSIPPGSEMTYDFTTNQTGTYWYHSHNMGQYPDGLRGPMVVHDPSPPFEYDAEFTLTLSDWYNEQMPTLLEYYESLENQESNGGHEPIPNAALINDASDTKIQVEPNKVYLVRFVCLGNWPGHTFVFDDHTMTVVEVDGVYTEPYEATGKKLRMATGQRMSVLIHTKPDASRNYAFWNTIDVNMMFFYENRSIPPNFNPNVTAWLVYDGNKELPPAPDIHKLDPNADFIDDVAFVPYEKEELLEPVDKQIVLHTASQKVNGIDRYTVNGKTYIPQNVPSLYTALSASNSSDPEVYGQVNPIIVHHNEVVEIVLNNHHNNLHPWHLHGHQFQVLQRSAVDGGSFHGYFQNISSTPIRRDTIMVQNHGHTVIRFRADNPDCHIEWHVEKGLLATLIEAPEVMNMSIPDDHRSVCSSYGAPTSGNAAGNTGDNLSGAPTNIAPGDSGAMWNPQADDDSSTSTTTSSSTLAGSPTKQPTVPQNTPSPAPTTTSQPQPTPPSNDPPPAAYTVDPYGDDALALYNNDDYVWVEQRHKMRLSPVATPSPSASASHSHE